MYGKVKKENIRWDLPFNELFTSENPVITQEKHKALGKFVAMHISENVVKDQ